MIILDFPGGINSKETACQCRRYKRHMGSIPGSGRSLEEGMVTHSNILAWRTLWPEEPGGLQPRNGTESDTTEVTWHTHMIISDMHETTIS